MIGKFKTLTSKTLFFPCGLTVDFAHCRYVACAPLSFLFAFILLCGSYLDELTCRKRFLQKAMIAYQQGRIIRMKTRSEGLQKELLQNMLPPMIVEELQKKNYKVSSWSELRTLSKRHVGVSLLFADLVGFTHMSSQVDPSSQ